mmetsp:Transcript_20517/g.61177  ORF Transcript_20517/g.61177 Transcript_20517/m.61177 type:complete len:125 (+) Transcript_20517:152-526(+)
MSAERPSEIGMVESPQRGGQLRGGQQRGRATLDWPAGREPRVERRRLPPRTCCLAVVLTLIGTLCLCFSLVFFASGRGPAIELLFLAAITLVPGSYASYHLIGIKLQWPGFDNVVLFSDDLELV